MPLTSTPNVVTEVLQAINNLSNDAFVACFTSDAVVINEGHTYAGIEAISKWNNHGLIGHRASIAPKEFKEHQDSTIVHVLMDGDLEADYNITEPFDLYLTFTLQGPLISHLTLTPWDPSTTATMKAVLANKANINDPLSAIQIANRPQPTAPAGWVKIKMIAAGLNYHDIFTLRGIIAGPPPKSPLAIGCEGVGSLEDGTLVVLYPEMGDPNFKGDETLDPKRHVFSEIINGTLAEFVIAPERNVARIPKGLDPIDASVLGIAWLTAYRMLFTKSGLRAGQVMLVQGSSGGVTTALIQMGSAAGMRVWCTGRTAAKRELALSLGAERVFLAGEELPEKADAVFDTSGEVTWAHSIQSVKTGGTIVTCGGHAGMSVPMDLPRVFVEQITIKGSYLGTLAEFADLIAFVVAKGLKPRIGKVMRLDEVREGFRMMIEGETEGKIVVTM